jgi:2-dehydro-3-deoxyglucarate aldolase
MFGTVPDYFAQSNNNITILVQIESQQGVDNVDAIAATAWTVSSSAQATWLRRWDTWVMRVTRTYSTPFNTSLPALKPGKPCGILAPVEADARRYLEWGATFVAVGSDLGVFRSATQKLADAFKNNHH